ncbi:MAG TPA: MFS transporter [Nitrospirota bacterium]|nr:MFS transporter [Nitrospirota bacterium]
MKNSAIINLQFLVFFLVMAAFTNIYITQPVLPVLQKEFGAEETRASLTVSSVILGIALANLPFGMLADQYAIKPIILIGGVMVSVCSLYCAAVTSLWLFILVRFVQGLFIPALTTCLAAYLARSLPQERLNTVMGSYVSATVAGGLGGRLLGGWIYPPLHWRYAFVSASLLLLAATLFAFRALPSGPPGPGEEARSASFLKLVARKELLHIYLVAFSAFFAFSSIFNYLPFYLAGPEFNAHIEVITMMYLGYLIGIAIGPLAGKISNRVGNGTTLALGAAIFWLFLALTLIRSLPVIAVSLAGICAGFFTIHAGAVGSLNRTLTSNHGRANSLYVLFYYLGGAIGITLSGFAYLRGGWSGVAALSGLVLLVPFIVGEIERVKEKNPNAWG